MAPRAVLYYRGIVDDKPDVYLGPLFAVGVVLVAVGLLRRSRAVAVAGLSAIWIDQRAELGRRVHERFDARLKAQIKAHARD